MKRSFRPALERLESIELQSVVHGHRPKPHQAHVVPHEVRAPHQRDHFWHAGFGIGGQIACVRQNAQAAEILAGSGTLALGGQRFASVGLAITDTQIAISCDAGTIQGSVVKLPDGSVGNYTITNATGAFAGAQGTGTFFVHPQTDGTFSVSINPHQ